jgi:hypothetical protein
MIGTAEPAAERRRMIEALAQSLYEESDPAGVPWARRPRVVRDAWLLVAERQLSDSENRPG